MGPSRYATRGTGISNCRSYDHLNWVRHDNCRVVYNGIAFSYSFYADYSTAKSGKVNATIRNMHSPIIHRAIGHTTSSPSLEITQQWQNRNISPASARMSFQATAVKVLWTTTLSLTLEVSGGRAQALSWCNYDGIWYYIFYICRSITSGLDTIPDKSGVLYKRGTARHKRHKRRSYWQGEFFQ